MTDLIRTRRNGRLSALLTLVAALFLGLARADGGGSPGGGIDPGLPASSPGDEVTSLPVSVDPSGLTLIGRGRDIRALVLDVQGRGRVFVMRLGDNRVAVTLMGDYQVALDRRRLAQGEVQLAFRGGSLYGGGTALLSVAGGDPTTSSAQRVQLPAARLAASDFTGVGLELLVRDGAHRARAAALYRAERVTFTQRLR